jgi:hypothetical protein
VWSTCASDQTTVAAPCGACRFPCVDTVCSSGAPRCFRGASHPDGWSLEASSIRSAGPGWSRGLVPNSFHEPDDLRKRIDAGLVVPGLPPTGSTSGALRCVGAQALGCLSSRRSHHWQPGVAGGGSGRSKTATTPVRNAENCSSSLGISTHSTAPNSPAWAPCAR